MELVDRHVEVETPEHVALGFELAGPGSRFAAFLYDAILLSGALLALSLITVVLAIAASSTAAVPIIVALMLLLGFATFWGYFAWFEGAREGQTPGKKRFALRVVHEGGYPLTMRGAVVRNLLRIVDTQPWPSCLIGGLTMLVHPNSQRLGDMAAGTIVVRERPVAALPEEAASAGPPRLSDAEYDVLREYALRREGLEADARARVAGKLAPHFMQHASHVPKGWLVNAGDARHADLLLRGIYTTESGRRAAAGSPTGSGSPAAASLLRRQRDRWADYTALLGRARERHLGGLPEAEVSRFAALYREVAADLARARTYGASPDLLYTLERWVASGHNLLYRRPPRAARRAWHWLQADFPALVRRRRAVILLATTLFYGPAVISYAAIAEEPARARTIVPAEMIARAEEGAARQARGAGYLDVPEVAMPLLSSGIIANNVQVTFLAFAGGIIAGLGTILILLTNGVFLGGVAGLFHVEHLDLYFWSFVAPHGVLELTAICIAGGAGLWLGSALVLPGRRTRRSALVERGREAVSLLGGTVVLLILAGLIEGFISPGPLPAALKLSFAALTLVALAAYLAIGGRGTDAGLTEAPAA